MTDLEKELIQCRKRWAEAKRKGDVVCMGLWERVGKNLKERIAERVGKPVGDLFETAKKLFGGEETK